MMRKRSSKFNLAYIAALSALAWYFYQDTKKKAGKTLVASTSFGVRG